MHTLTVARCRPPQLIDRALNAMPDCPPVHVALGQQLISTLCGV